MAELLQLRTLGTLSLRGPDGHELESVLAQTKRVGLLVYLAVAAPRGFHRRDKLVALFWPELDQEHARAALRRALSFLRAALGKASLNAPGAEDVALTPTFHWCDAVAFEELLTAGRLEEALELYRGDFLDGFHVAGHAEFERWQAGQRAGLRQQAARAAWTLAERATAAGNAVQAAQGASGSRVLPGRRSWGSQTD
ncbi:MAG: hypothetical protein HY700_21205 [Gemmatimonadetes bacterium]|nr:hypothetical protein [Gemmatimonadota bacterium]